MRDSRHKHPPAAFRGLEAQPCQHASARQHWGVHSVNFVSTGVYIPLIQSARVWTFRRFHQHECVHPLAYGRGTIYVNLLHKDPPGAFRGLEAQPCTRSLVSVSSCVVPTSVHIPVFCQHECAHSLADGRDLPGAFRGLEAQPCQHASIPSARVCFLLLHYSQA